MVFTEEDAIKVIKNLLNFNDYNKIIQVLKGMNPEIFKNKELKKKFKEVLANMYNTENVNYIKNILSEFIKEYSKYEQRSYHLWFCSNQFRNKFKKSDFNNPGEIKRFRDLIRKIVELKNSYPTETIGEFFMSPRGHERHRIAWYMTSSGIYFCEPFNDHEEYDNFCDRARHDDIKRKNYSGWDYAEAFSPLNLAAI
ncbi:MAG: hypothetical protein AABX55_02895 [Nanoarchaeota archaeon]